MIGNNIRHSERGSDLAKNLVRNMVQASNLGTNESLTRINVAIRPGKEAQKQLVRLSEEIGKQAETFFVLDGKNYYPHVTLYSPAYPDRNLPEVFGKIREICQTFPKFEVELTGVESHWGYIGIELEPTNKIKKLHEQIVEQVNPLREGYLRDKYHDQEELAKYSEAQKDHIQKFGYPDVLEMYYPHLTLARLPDEDRAEEIAKKLNLPFEELSVEIITACKTGPHGTCVEVVKEFKLGK